MNTLEALKPLRARRATQKAIREGRLIRQPCEVCGAVNTAAHHDDYDKPLDVRWLCVSHHSMHHKPRALPKPVLPSGVTGPRYRHYTATGRDDTGYPVFLGHFRTVEEAAAAVAKYGSEMQEM